MMARVKLALLSDLHANLRAFDACLAHARAAGATRFALLGDLVGYGPEPVQLLERVMALAQEGAIVLRGNHDDAARQPPAARDTAEAVLVRLDPCAAGSRAPGLPGVAAADGDRGRCAAGACQRARSAAVGVRGPPGDGAPLPGGCGGTVGAAPRVLRPRARAAALLPGRGRQADGVQPRAGRAVPLAAHRSWLALVGSVGQPRDGDPRAMYALLDAAQARLSFHRIAYDHVGAAAAVRAAGLPEGFAQRLERGR
jgi:predicted phosphodiesterase